MEKDIFFKIISLYKKERNLTRLVYRLIKYEYEGNIKDKTKWLSKKQIFNRIIKIVYSKDEIELEKRRIESERKDALNKKILFLKNKGFVNITKIDDFSYYYNEKDTGTLYYGDIRKIISDIDNSYFININNEIDKSIKKLISLKYIKAYEVKNANPTGKKFINTGKTIRYKTLK